MIGLGLRALGQKGFPPIADGHPAPDTRGMEGSPRISRLAERFRWPIALTGAASAAVAAANLLSLVADRVTIFAAAAIGLVAASVFLCALTDMGFQRAVSAMNADRRAQARQRGWLARLFGIGLPMGDRVLLSVLVLLLTVTLWASELHRPAAAALGFAGFFLLGVVQAGLMVRGYPTGRFAPPFS